MRCAIGKEKDAPIKMFSNFKSSNNIFNNPLLKRNNIQT